MKITKRQLKRIISEEIQKCMLNESSAWGPSPTPEQFASGEWLDMPIATSSDRGGDFDLDLSKVFNIVVSGINMADSPDFVDAYIESAEYEHSPGQYRDLTQEEIDHLASKENEWVYQQIWDQVH